MVVEIHTNGVFADTIPNSKEMDLPGGGNWVVQKYGGTSIGKFPLKLCEIVQNSLKTHRVAVVCSARSNNTKSSGTTSRLLAAAKEAEIANSRGYVPLVQMIQEDHVEAARGTIKDAAILAAYVQDVEAECASLVKILESAQHLEEVTVRAENKIMAKGEKLACKFMTALLSDNGVEAQYVDLSDVIKRYNINTTGESFYQQLAFAFGTEVENCGDKVPVITGYFGHVPSGLLNVVGRGYTDLASALVAVGLHASELQIWKEVDGIFTADPRKVPTARLIPRVSPSETAELTFYGSEVIHPFTMDQAIRAKIPLRIKNVMNPKGTGTIIYPDEEEQRHAAQHAANPLKPKLFRTRSSSDLDRAASKPKRPTAVTIKQNIVVLNVHSTRRTRAHGFLARIFGILDRWHLSVDLIASSEVNVSMALYSERGSLVAPCADGRLRDGEDLQILDDRLRGAVADLAALGHVDIAPDMAIVSLVGKELKNSVGISGKFFSVLGESGINIEMISQGASEINISCVIWARDADRALNVLHTNLFTFLD